MRHLPVSAGLGEQVKKSLTERVHPRAARGLGRLMPRVAQWGVLRRKALLGAAVLPRAPPKGPLLLSVESQWRAVEMSHLGCCPPTYPLQKGRCCCRWLGCARPGVTVPARVPGPGLPVPVAWVCVRSRAALC